MKIKELIEKEKWGEAIARIWCFQNDEVFAGMYNEKYASGDFWFKGKDHNWIKTKNIHYQSDLKACFELLDTLTNNNITFGCTAHIEYNKKFGKQKVRLYFEDKPDIICWGDTINTAIILAYAESEGI